MVLSHLDYCYFTRYTTSLTPHHSREPTTSLRIWWGSRSAFASAGVEWCKPVSCRVIIQLLCLCFRPPAGLNIGSVRRRITGFASNRVVTLPPTQLANLYKPVRSLYGHRLFDFRFCQDFAQSFIEYDRRTSPSELLQYAKLNKIV